MTALSFMHLMVIALLMGLLLSAAWTDLKTYRISNYYSLALLALYPCFLLTASYPPAPVESLGLAAGVLAFGILAYAFNAMGAGDVKLLAATSLFAGPAFVGEFLLITLLAGGALALVMLNQPLRIGMATALDSMGARAIPNALLSDVLPYGIAIGAGGAYLSLRLVAVSLSGV